MANIPTPSNPPVETADEIIHLAIYDMAVDGAVLAIEAKYPILANPFIDKTLRITAKFFAKYLYEMLSRFVTFEIIDAETWMDTSAYAKAESDLRKATVSGNEDAIKKAKVAFNTSLKAIVHYKRT